MFCVNCGKELSKDAKFCIECGTPVGQVAVHPTERTYCDKNGNPINLSKIVGVYKNKLGIAGYFQRCTDYTKSEISEIVTYAMSTVEPTTMSFMERASEQIKLEEAASSKANQPTKRERIRENRKNGVACCPKCGSTSLSANKKGFGVGKAVIGAGLALNPLGLIAGNINARKVWVTCLNCGHRWKV